MSAVVPVIAAGLEAQAGQATAPTVAPARAIDPVGFVREDRRAARSFADAHGIARVTAIARRTLALCLRPPAVRYRNGAGSFGSRAGFTSRRFHQPPPRAWNRAAVSAYWLAWAWAWVTTAWR